MQPAGCSQAFVTYQAELQRFQPSLSTRLRPSSARHLPLPLPQDIYTLFHLNRDFKFISKTSNFLIPIIGWSMFLTGGGRGAPTQSGIPAPVLLLRGQEGVVEEAAHMRCSAKSRQCASPAETPPQRRIGRSALAFLSSLAHRPAAHPPLAQGTL